jgi:hypothetical protein
MYIGNNLLCSSLFCKIIDSEKLIIPIGILLGTFESLLYKKECYITRK